MPRLFKVKGFEEKRRALAAESEVYRETLKLEVQNLQIYAMRTQRRFHGVTKASPLLMFLLPLAKSFFMRKRKSQSQSRRGRMLRLMTAGYAGWQMYRKFSPMLTGIFSFLQPAKRPGASTTGQNARAENF